MLYSCLEGRSFMVHCCSFVFVRIFHDSNMMLGETIGERAKSSGLQLCGINLIRPCCQVMYLKQIPNFDKSMVKGSVFGEVEVILGNMGISHGAYVLGVLSVLWACLKHFKSSQLQHLRTCEPSICMAKLHGCSQGIHIQIFGMSPQIPRK